MLKVALVSLNQSWEDKEKNKKKILSCLEDISDNDIDLVIFPEMTLTGFTMNSLDYVEDFNSSPTISFFQECARKHNIYIMFGVILQGKIKPTNNLIVVSPCGEVLASYAKIHPFSYAGENNYYEAGQELVITRIKDIPIGLSICYDLRFPEIFQAMSDNADMIINIANWPNRRITQWKALLIARAIENQAFFIGANRIGLDGKGNYYSKSSYIISPDGIEQIPILSVGDEIDVYEFDIAAVSRYRKSFPVKNDRRVNLYKEFADMAKIIYEVEIVKGVVSYPTDINSISGRNFSRLLFICEDMKEGDVLTEKNLRSIRPENGLHPKYLNECLGKKVNRDLEKGTPLSIDFIRKNKKYDRNDKS